MGHLKDCDGFRPEYGEAKIKCWGCAPRHDGFSEMDRWDPKGFQADGDGLWMVCLKREETLPGGTFIVRKGRWVAIRFTDMDEHINDWEKGDGYLRYEATVCMVDLDTIPPATLASARESCGWEGMPEDGDAGFARAMAEACIRYGCYAPIGSHTGGDLRKVLRDARREAKDMMADSDALAEAMEKPVNALGSTASEYMRGDLDAALARGLSEGSPNARIMAQMQAPIPSGPIQANIRMGDVPSDDPIAYSMGFLAGFQGSEETHPSSELADAYLAGREHGAKVRLGREPIPGWVA